MKYQSHMHILKKKKKKKKIFGGVVHTRYGSQILSDTKILQKQKLSGKLPKKWKKKINLMKIKSVKHDLRIIPKSYAYFQTMAKTCMKCQKELPTTARGVAQTRYLLCIQFDIIEAKMRKKLERT